ncbi:hemerythrin family protein [Clostridium sp. D2Q-14]|uniref:bacteriohemerythrin n=1 Tax=Anaeromonas gelatinilytica TaxID=2683194 RepID=UPI00193B2910|nr:hemerythrin family protein [Anaeromonas gelatinilytica]MBS4535049.1 hemerythrin family protein [Anaeromonas gelatinilytica]
MFKWKDDFSCNIEEIDKQHQRLFEIGRNLYTLVTSKDDLDHYDEIMAIMKELEDYTIYHFDYEEKLMEKYDYDQLEEHKKQHVMFVERIKELQTEDIDLKQDKVVMDALMFVADWIEKHILKIDHKYKDMLNEKGVY